MDKNELPPPTGPVGDLAWTGGDIDRLDVSLRVFGDDLDPDAVTVLLDCQPTQAYRKGDTLPSRRSHQIANTGLWILHGAKESPGVLEERISGLLDNVSDDRGVWSALASFRKDVFCGLFLEQWNRGCSLSPALMRRLAERDLTLELDLYCGGEDE